MPSLEELKRIRQYHENKESSDRMKYERSLVRTLLSRLGITPLDLSIKHAYDLNNEHGAGGTFAWFDTEFPDFPVFLTCQEIRDPEYGDFFRPHSRDNSLWVPWNDVVSTIKVQKAVGCIFRPTQLSKLGPMVMHNYMGGHNDEGFVFMRSTVGGKEVTLEPLESLLERVKLRWTYR